MLNISENTVTVKLIIACALILFLGFSVYNRLDNSLDKVVIRIKTRNDNKYLVNKSDVQSMIRSHLGYEIVNSNIGKVDLYDLEAFLEDDDRISRAELYIDKRSYLFINILQNLPIARIDVTGGEDYYLDYEGKRIDLKGDLIRVPVVTGFVDSYSSSYSKNDGNNLNDILKVARKLYEDDFLEPLVEQIDIEDNDDITLTTKLGRTKIEIGSVEGLDDKMYRLKTYYKNGIKNIGINKFEELNLRYDGQIVGKKAS